MAVLGGWAVSYERGTPVHLSNMHVTLQDRTMRATQGRFLTAGKDDTNGAALRKRKQTFQDDPYPRSCRCSGAKSEKTLEARDGTCAQEKQRGCANRDLFIAAHETGARQNAVETARENKEPGRERQAARGNESAGGHRGFRDLRFIHHGT